MTVLDSKALIENNVSEVHRLLRKKGETLATAESLTAGLAASYLASESGASANFKGGIIAYSDEIKIKRLDVKRDTIEQFGAVSAECAKEMAQNVKYLLGVDIGLALTGNAGPKKSEGKDVGLVYLSLYRSSWGLLCKEFHFKGDRDEIRHESVSTILKMLIETYS